MPQKNRLNARPTVLAIAISLWMPVVMPAPSLAATEAELSAAKRRIAELEQENRLLKAQLKLAKDQVEHLKKKVDEAEAKAKQLDPNPDDPTKTKFDPQVGAAAQGLRVYQSALHILRELPKELRPHPKDGWDALQYEEVRKWMAKHPTGNTFRATMKIARVTAGKTGSTYLKQGKKPRYIQVTFEPDTFKYLGLTLREQFGSLNTSSPFTFFLDEKSARASEQVRAGQRATISGTISGIGLMLYSGKSYGKISIHLTEAQLESPRLE